MNGAPQITEEANELALRIVEMVRAAPEKAPWGESGADLINGLKKFVETVEVNDSNDLLQTKLRLAFTNDPSLACTIFESQDWPWPFRLVLRQELEEIGSRRARMDGGAPPQQANAPDVYLLAGNSALFGLALSGGGIRSATFNLGVLQRLAEHGLLNQVDYLSTVSGGGYIGTWLNSWIQRLKNPAEVFHSLSPADNRDPNTSAVKPIRFLRQFSNYLTPRLGLFSSDTWAMIAIYIRNVALNLTILISGFAALLLLPRLIGHSWMQSPSGVPAVPPPAMFISMPWLLIVGFALLFVAVFSISQNVKQATDAKVSKAQANPGGFYGPVGIQVFCCTPLLLSAYAMSWWVWENLKEPVLSDSGSYEVPALGFAALSLLLAGRSHLSARFQERIGENKLTYRLVNGLIRLLVPAGVGITGLVLFRGYIAILNCFAGLADQGSWHALVFGPPLFLMMLSIAAIVHVGLLGIDLLDSGREWLSRFRGLTNIYTTFWLALFIASVYGGLLFAKFALWSSRTLAALGLAWVVTTITSFLAGGSAKSGDPNEPQRGVSTLQIAAKLGPPVFVVGFVWVIAVAIHLLLALGSPSMASGSVLSFTDIERSYWDVLKPETYLGWDILLPGTLALLCAGVALLLAWRVDINEFSMHHFYKNRLVRCYLGATNKTRRPNAFTGFDQSDDIHLSKFKPSECGAPYHIINTTLNLSAGKNLAWQERKAASFFFSPLFSGYDYNLASPEASIPEKSDFRSRTRGSLRSCAFRKTGQYAFKGGVHIGTAMSISGAAADPNQGYNTSPAIAFLMTVFDVRLGWWLGNPRIDKKSKLRSPVFGLAALISELLGTTDDTTNFVNLSDGGHFDNMGLYELVRRRCRYIIVCDAEQDSSYEFGGLGMAIRKCRIDFGAEIDIDPQQIAPNPDTHRSVAHCAVGQITYENGSTGVLVYIKASLTGDEPEDLLEYAAAHPKFPHESTADQWFTESQFESYRKLGYHAADSTLSPSRIFSASPHVQLPDVFEALQKYWFPINPGLQSHAIKHTNALNELMLKIGATPGLHVLGAQLFPGAGNGVGQADSVAEFYFCMCLIQLVEDIYFDFGLDHLERRDDPRIGGWMNLFKAWKQSSRVKQVWTSQSGTFRKDFQDFWSSL